MLTPDQKAQIRQAVIERAQTDPQLASLLKELGLTVPGREVNSP